MADIDRRGMQANERLITELRELLREEREKTDKLLLKFGLLKSRGGMFAHTGTANEGSPAMRSDKAEAKPSPPLSRATESGGDADQLENSKDRTESRFQRRLHTIT